MRLILREHVYKRYTRSSSWSKFRRMVIRKHPRCAVCGKTKGLEVHHIIPVHIAPKLELEEFNIIVLCRPKRCHLLFGHFNNWKKYNPHVLYEAYRWYKLLTGKYDTNSSVYRDGLTLYSGITAPYS